MSDKMVKIGGQEFSESTIKEALKKHCGFEEKSYQFQAGDVASRSQFGGWRIIVNSGGTLMSFDLDGQHQTTKQSGFEINGYEKITTLRKLIECWEKNNG